MRYAEIKPVDIANGTGVGVALFVQGCKFHCKECFNTVTWDFTGGKEFTEAVMDQILELLAPAYIKRLTILGGEPLVEENREGVLWILQRVRAKYPTLKIWLYTGYVWEQVKDLEHIKYLDTLVDGRFEADLKDITLKFRGSSNQRIIDVKKSLEAEEVVRWDTEK